MEMLLDLSRVRGPHAHVDRRFDASAFAVEDGYRVVSSVTFKAVVRRDGTQIRLTGHVAGTLELACSRCLEPFTLAVDCPFDHRFLPAGAGGEVDGDRELGADDDAVGSYTDDTISLADVMRESFYLALPMKPLCREDCAGLCPVCGRNRNRDQCSCQAEWVDPRMEPLRRLRSTP